MAVPPIAFAPLADDDASMETTSGGAPYNPRSTPKRFIAAAAVACALGLVGVASLSMHPGKKFLAGKVSDVSMKDEEQPDLSNSLHSILDAVFGILGGANDEFEKVAEGDQAPEEAFKNTMDNAADEVGQLADAARDAGDEQTASMLDALKSDIGSAEESEPSVLDDLDLGDPDSPPNPKLEEAHAMVGSLVDAALAAVDARPDELGSGEKTPEQVFEDVMDAESKVLEKDADLFKEAGDASIASKMTDLSATVKADATAKPALLEAMEDP